MSRFSIFISLLLFAGGDCFGQNINQNVNQNSIVINNLPVIEKKEYIVKYRTVYKDRPQPKRYARKLGSPICLLDYLWIYPEDLGTYPNGPSEIIAQINKQGRHGRNTWRVPTDDELRLMENYADKCGLGDDIYLSTSHRNGILRLVSTGQSVKEQNEAARKQQLQEANERAVRKAEEERERAARMAKADADHRDAVNRQRRLLSSGNVYYIDGLIWDSSNNGAKNPYDKGVAYASISLQDGWRLPTANELRTLIKQSVKYGTYFQHPSGLIIPFGTYAVEEGYILLPNMMSANGNTPKLIRKVQNKLY